MTRAHIADLLPLFVLDVLEPDESLLVMEHLAACEDCALVLEEASELPGLLAQSVAPVPPPPMMREKVLDAFAGGKRFATFAPDVAALLGLSEERIMQLFDDLDDLANWLPGPTKGCHLMPVSEGRQGAFVGFIRLAPNHTFPTHQHHGDEFLYILAGGYINDKGEPFLPGQLDHSSPDSTHSLVAMEWIPCICAIVVEEGFSFVSG